MAKKESPQLIQEGQTETTKPISSYTTDGKTEISKPISGKFETPPPIKKK